MQISEKNYIFIKRLMKTIILAGGFGTRISEFTHNIPKPMVEIGGKPLLWHIMNIYAHFEFKEFIIALGYKAEVVKEYFLNFYAINNDFTLDLATGQTEIHRGNQQDWLIHLIDTGQKTETGGRIKRLKKWIGNETFFLTYGDGVADVNIEQLLAFHKSHGKLATVTGVHPPARFGSLEVEGEMVSAFSEKCQSKMGWINGGFFVLEPEVLDYIQGDETVWEKDCLEQIARDHELHCFQHEGFWQPMDTLREYRILESLWDQGKAPWKVWDGQREMAQR